MEQEQKLLQLVQDNQYNNLKIFLDQNPNLDFQVIIDQDILQNVLHISVNNQNFMIVTLLVSYYEKFIKEMKKINQIKEKTYHLRNLIDMRENNGFSSLHCAAFKGELQILEFLQKKGGDIYAVNSNGITLMHNAAQGNSPLIMQYLLMNGLDIHQKDNSGRNALHWACYYGAENSAIFCLAQNIDILTQDTDVQMSPLHLAVNSGSTRLVQRLLRKGADKFAKDIFGKTSYDIAIENEYFNIQSVLSKEDGLAEFCNIKQPTQNMKRRQFLFYAFLVTYAFIYTCQLFFVIPFSPHTIYNYFHLIIFCITSILFVLCTFKDPGYPTIQPDQYQFLYILKNHEFSKICVFCKILRPERTKHCEICNKCVNLYDHHCPWIDNCVGAKNYIFFYLFVSTMAFQLFFQIFFNIINITESGIHMEFIRSLRFSHDTLYIMHIIISSISVMLSLLFLAPVVILLGIQSINLMKGLTTWERYSRQKNSEVDGKESKTDESEQKTDKEQSMISSQSTQLQETSSELPKKSKNDSKFQNCINICYYNQYNKEYQYQNEKNCKNQKLDETQDIFHNLV